MTVGDIILNSEDTFSAQKPIKSAFCEGKLLGRRAETHRRLLVIQVLTFSDILLALAVWQVAFVLQSSLGRGSLSEIAIASTLPYVVIGVWLCASLGLYPGYGLS